MSSNLVESIVRWREEELLPVSKQDIVKELSVRLEPVIADLLQRINDMEKKLDNIARQQQNIIQNSSKEKY